MRRPMGKANAKAYLEGAARRSLANFFRLYKLNDSRTVSLRQNASPNIPRMIISRSISIVDRSHAFPVRFRNRALTKCTQQLASVDLSQP
jgi:hypothetical protein